MPKLLSACSFLILLLLLQGQAFAAPAFNCKFKSERMEGIQTIHISEESLLINHELEIPLAKSQVICGHFGRQTRLDGNALGYQVILKSCSTDAELEGHLIDSVHAKAVEVLCNEEPNE